MESYVKAGSHNNIENVRNAVNNVVRTVEYAEDHDSRSMRGSLSMARRLYGKMPSDDALATSETLAVLVRNKFDMDDAQFSSFDGLDNASRAAVIAIALYAGSGRDHQSFGSGVGQALASIPVRDGKDSMDQPLLKSLMAADDFASIVYRLSRALSRVTVRPDHGLLAVDLLLLQSHNIETRNTVKTRWATDFYKSLNTHFGQHEDKSEDGGRQEE